MSADGGHGVIMPRYLKSMSPAEELALFLSLRGHCLKEAGRNAEAAAAYAEAVRLAPESRPYRLLLADSQSPPSPRPSDGLPGPGPVPDPNPRLQIR